MSATTAKAQVILNVMQRPPRSLISGRSRSREKQLSAMDACGVSGRQRKAQSDKKQRRVFACKYISLWYCSLFPWIDPAL